MKVAIASDLHLEFGDCEFTNTENAEVLILSGDILVVDDLRAWDSANLLGEGPKSPRWHELMQRCSHLFPHVIFVMGNHEYYHGNFSSGVRKLKERLAYLPNVYVLERESKTIGDVTFIGGTLWTDFNDMDSHTMYNAEKAMNDYKGVKNTNDTVSWKFLPKHALRDHSDMRGYLQTCMDNYKDAGRTDNKIVVITHHAPSPRSVHEKYANDKLMNGNFYTNMDEFIINNPQIQLWIHGHMHDPFDYGIGGTRVYCNPRGYIQYEQRAQEFKLEVIELL